MKFLIAGLGNPGPQYELTRHNIGFLVLDQLAEKLGASFKTDRLAEVAEAKYKGKSLVLIKPNTYMNLSGKAVNYWLQSENISRENFLAVVDDLALPHATLRLRAKGSAGGHNGLSSIQEHLQSDQYKRLRFGIGNDYSKGKQAEYVLSNFSQEQLDQILSPLEKSCEIILSFCTAGLEKTKTQYNV